MKKIFITLFYLFYSTVLYGSVKSDLSCPHMLKGDSQASHSDQNSLPIKSGSKLLVESSEGSLNLDSFIDKNKQSVPIEKNTVENFSFLYTSLDLLKNIYQEKLNSTPSEELHEIDRLNKQLERINSLTDKYENRDLFEGVSSLSDLEIAEKFYEEIKSFAIELRSLFVDELKSGVVNFSDLSNDNSELTMPEFPYNLEPNGAFGSNEAYQFAQAFKSYHNQGKSTAGVRFLLQIIDIGLKISKETNGDLYREKFYKPVGVSFGNILLDSLGIGIQGEYGYNEHSLEDISFVIPESSSLKPTSPIFQSPIGSSILSSVGKEYLFLYTERVKFGDRIGNSVNGGVFSMGNRNEFIDDQLFYLESDKDFVSKSYKDFFDDIFSHEFYHFWQQLVLKYQKDFLIDLHGQSKLSNDELSSALKKYISFIPDYISDIFFKDKEDELIRTQLTYIDPNSEN